jgi:hypothetical protein
MANSSGSFMKELKAMFDPPPPFQKKMAVVEEPPVEYLLPETTTKKKKKKILCEVPASEVREVMNYKPKPYKVDIPDELIRCCPELAAAIFIRETEIAPVSERYDRWMLERKEDFARQLKAKGIVTREYEVDEDYDEEKDYTPIFQGRRRYRPGVMKKHQGRTRKC